MLQSLVIIEVNILTSFGVNGFRCSVDSNHGYNVVIGIGYSVLSKIFGAVG